MYFDSNTPEQQAHLDCLSGAVVRTNDSDLNGFDSRVQEICFVAPDRAAEVQQIAQAVEGRPDLLGMGQLALDYIVQDLL